jgi:glycosyltransferase involved in cell wall biosynthesis
MTNATQGKTLKVFIADPHLLGGGQVRYVTNLAHQLTHLGHEVTIGCKPKSVLVDSAREAGCSVLNKLLLRGGLRPRIWWHDFKTVQEFIRKEKPDVIHVNGSQDHWVCALANQFMRHPVCIVRTRHNTYPVKDNYPNRLLNLKWTDYQIVVCDVVRQDLASQPAFDKTRMCSIHNGIDPKLFAPNPEARARARAEFGYTDDHMVCGIVARLEQAKGHEFLFRAIADVRSDFPQLRLLILGRGKKKRELKKLADDLKIQDISHFAGFRNDMADCMQAFDFGVQPSIDCDTSSFSLKEQMAAEKPVVASDYGGFTEIIANGREGWIVPAGTVEQLAVAIREILKDRKTANRMGKAGRDRVLKDFTIQVFAERTVEAYRRAIEFHHKAVSH